MVSLGAMIYLIGRAVPRVSDEVGGGESMTKFDRLLSSMRFEKVDVLLNNFLEKLLRKVKLLLMKLDNTTNNYLNKVKKFKLPGNGQKNGEEKPNLFENKTENTEVIENNLDKQ